MRSKRACAVILCGLLTGCSAPLVKTVHLCLPEVTYDAPSVQGVVAELDKAELSGVSMPYTERMIVDYHQMRLDNATCKKGTSK